MKAFLFRKTDNAPLIVFRIIYGLLVCAECFGAIGLGWVKRNLIDPKFTFTFIGFEWLQPLPGVGMYIYFIVMGICGIGITLGYRYRASAFGFAILWTGVYLMQKTSYNNHYYLLMLLSFIMAFLPAHKAVSLDVKRLPNLKQDWMLNGIRWIIILQLFIVYTYAAIAKMYEDWFNLTVIEGLMKARSDYFLIGDFLQLPTVHQAIAIFGVFFDLLIVPMLLWKRTRILGLVLSIFFHLFNSIVFGIGIFPYLSLGFLVFFFDPKVIRRRFLPQKKNVVDPVISQPRGHNWILGVLGIYFIIQLLLPLRHHTFKDDVLWTEEGHRLSWRMMLRSRSGNIRVKVVNTANQRAEFIKLKEHLSDKQQQRVATYPDFAWQFAQYLKKEYAKKGEDIQVFVFMKVRVNQGKYSEFIDPTVDLANVPWNHFSHNEWIKPSQSE